jgi:hypothetical protein
MFVGIFSHPRGVKKGCGKSVFGLRYLVKVYGGWEEAREFIVFTVDEFKQLLARYGSIKAVLWDDAGVWLGATRARRKEVREFIAMVPEVKKRVEMLMFTAGSPRDIARGVRDALDLYIYIYRELPLELGLKQLKNLWTAVAYVYDKENGIAFSRGLAADAMYTIKFDIWFDYYEEYEEMRERHVKMLLREHG